jgi:hypothetical protein
MEAAVNGRRVTLDPVMEREPVPLPVRRVESALPTGFRVEWLTGNGIDDDGATVEFNLTVGAGFGSPWMVLTINHAEHGRIEEVVNIQDVVEAWVNAAVAAGATPKVG